MNVSIALAMLTILIGVLMLWDEFSKNEHNSNTDTQQEQSSPKKSQEKH